MKKMFIIMVLCSVLTLTLAAQNPTDGVEISFVFNRQIGLSSNQYAVWIEDSSGSFVKTLYATRFTASGGWARRPQSIPLWVQKSALSGQDKKDVDATSGATPHTGTVNYRWDGRGTNGLPLTGEYRVFLEATLRGDTRVLYSAAFTLGGQADGLQPLGAIEAEVKSAYFGDRTDERRMIESVRVVYR